MIINGVEIEDTFAEAFSMRATRVIITAINYKWARHAAQTMTGFATSVIGCGVEAGIEKVIGNHETPDGRPGISVLLFSTDKKTLEKQLQTRIGQCVLTCPTTAVFSGMDTEDRIALGKNIRYFGDGFQTSKKIGDKRFWRSHALLACEAAIDAISMLPNIIMPFPGGGVRSGSKVGSKYKFLSASTNHPYCPTLKGRPDNVLGKNIEACMEIVIDGLTKEDVSLAMQRGIEAVCDLGKSQGVMRIATSNASTCVG